MFDRIATRYDFLNHFFSFNADKSWRRRLVKEALSGFAATHAAGKVPVILDVATGTGDLAFEFLNAKAAHITGLDISPEMLAIARQKAAGRNLEMDFVEGDSESMPFPGHSFDIVCAAFGVRNFEHLEAGLKECCRVVNAEGNVYILEFSIPHNRIFRSLYFFYSRNILPWLARFLSNDSRAYRYLPESIAAFPSGSKFLEIAQIAGFTSGRIISLSGGIACIYILDKKKVS
jgi:demethylmenaquinone methyltransferase/2-methoxy-6-polyprenyl-1,4-benzoquinol methylase